jgi:Ca2+-transporting ATPase
MALCSTAMRVESDGESVMCGDPTEVALLRAVSACGASESSLRMEHRAVGEVPFESGRKMMSSIRLYGSKRLALVKGAPEKVIPRCTSVLIEGKPKPIAQKMARRFSSQAQQLGQDGMRVLALAYRPIAELPSYSSANTERSLVLVGLVAMEDPARPEVPQAIASCKSAGIRVIMLTGDSLHTAMAIASRVGLLGNGQRAVDGQRLEEMDDAGLARALSSAGLFARVTPEQKYRITKFLMESGEIVAVTGDGVNDAPALKRANIGVAMGIAGTDVSKEVADIVLTDDNFASIVNAVRYGRTIFANIKSFVRYQLTTNVAALLFMFLAPAFGLPLPLLPLQILWINIIMDGPPALALGAEPPAKDVMQKPPRNPSASFLSKNLIASILFLGTVMAAVSLCVFAFYVVAFEPYRAYTTAFTLFVFLQFFNALNCRSSHASVLSRPFSNPYLYFAIVICMGLQAAIIYYPPLQGIFGTVPLEPPDWGFILAAASLIVILEELKKKHLPQFTVY